MNLIAVSGGRGIVTGISNLKFDYIEVDIR